MPSSSFATPAYSNFSLSLSWVPPLWALVLVTLYAWRAFRLRYLPKRIRLPETDEDGRPRQKPLFAVFVEDEDILAAADVECNDIETTGAMREAVLPPTPLAVVLIPLVETLGWLAVTIFSFMRPTGSNGDLLRLLSFSGAWAIAFTLQLWRRTATAPLSLLSLYVVFSMHALADLVDYARSHTDTAPSLLLLAQFANMLLLAFLVTAILRMPLSPPLDVVIALYRAATHGSEGETRPRSPEDANTVLGAFTYSWLGDIMRVGKSRPLQPGDVWQLSLSNRAEVLSRRFSSLRSKTLTRKLLRASVRDVSIDATLKLVASTSDYLRPYFVQKILENITLSYSSPIPIPSPLSESPAPWSPREKAYLFTALAFLVSLVKTLSQQRHFHYARRIGMRLRSELTVALFEKSLRRRETAGKKKAEGGGTGEEKDEEDESASIGKIMSMISEDVNRVLRMGCDSHLIYGAPLEIMLGLVFLYNLMGWSALLGFGVLIMSVQGNYLIGKVAVRVARNRQAAGDRRRTALQELLAEIRTIKLFGWSEAWIDRVGDKRQAELDWLAKDWLVRYASSTLWALLSLAVPLVSFWAYVKLQGQDLTVAIAFTALSLFSLVRGPLNQIPSFSIRILQLNVSISRMEAFFAEPEISQHAVAEQRAAAPRLAMHGATMRYAGADSGEPALQDVTVVPPEGKLTVVSGPTGCGKTSLLLGFLGELELLRGRVELPASMSYAAQHPWLESLTVRDSITFGYPLDEKRLSAVIKACALERDLKIFPDGVQTFVGERGISLSGGQKARLALARAVYAPTSHLLVDDVFSAVDAHTSRHLLTHLFSGPLLRDRTCVLVTHHVDLLIPLASWYVELEGGRILRQGEVQRPERVSAKAAVEAEIQRMEEEDSGTEASEEFSKMEAAASPKGRVTGAKVEGWTSGEVQRSMYTAYFSASSYLLWAFTLAAILAKPALIFLEQFWLRRWGEAGDSGKEVDSTYYLAGYGLIGLASAFNTMLIVILVSLASLRASRTLFDRLLRRVVYAPLRFFDVVALGTLQNRFTNDISMVDDGLAVNVTEFVGNIAQMVAALGVVSFVLPAALVSSVLFMAIYASIFRSYLVVNRDVNRIAATTASPLFSSFAEALRGIVTIRAFGKQKEYRARLCRTIDDTLSFWYLGATLDVWLSIRTQVLSAFCLLATATFAIYYRVSPGLCGIAITSSQGVIQALDFLCTAYSRLVLAMNSLERITEYLDLPQEPAGGVIPPATWPCASAEANLPLLEVRDLVVRYAPELPPVLHGVSFELRAGERLGIVGRTGSGKSTLASSLLRFTDPESGAIIIDGLDTTKVSLTDLRQRITLVPQEPTLIEASLRENLDPLSEHSDADCLEALRRAHLIHSSESATTPGTVTPVAAGDGVQGAGATARTEIALDTAVALGGTNFSAGQRQLIAVARALLRNSRIVILDESSASLDHALDAQLQRVIREEFGDAAVLTIAHRLRTVVDYDRIVVLDAGRIVELDTPEVLLAKQDGVFRRMWEESGGGCDSQ
ncbi:uncharacterized protein JCM10292_002702 [Rhodotorula paludigena]|uniref:uncharacterized protein n=1 Tax=Rhodotorula paludigena TaxID=86838 RepID=UPI0031815149